MFLPSITIRTRAYKMQSLTFARWLQVAGTRDTCHASNPPPSVATLEMGNPRSFPGSPGMTKS